MSIRHKNKEIETQIEKYSKKGHGIGCFLREDGERCPIEVPFTVPGDFVRAQLLRRRAGLYRSHLQEIIKPSDERIKPKCKHFGVCGGCRWQQIPYKSQLRNKQKRVKAYFKELLSKEVDLRDILPCDNYWHYRNKMEFTFSSDKNHTPYLGLNMDAGKGKVFHLTECHLPNSWFVDAVEAVRKWWEKSELEAYHRNKDTGSLQTLTVREGMRTGDRMVILTVSGNSDYSLKKSHLESFVAFLCEAVELELSIFLIIRQIKKGQPTQFYEMHLYGEDHIREIMEITLPKAKNPQKFEFKISPSAFFQPNPYQAEKLYSSLFHLLDLPQNGIVYDLYCGTGTLGICAAQSVKEVIGIELSRESALDAKENIKLNQVENMTILTGDVGEKLREIQKDHLFPAPDVVLVDPPRAGLGADAIQHLLSLSPKTIGYVSCNPGSQAEDIKVLVEKGYQLTALQPVDQFPHTVHIENIAILKL